MKNKTIKIFGSVIVTMFLLVVMKPMIVEPVKASFDDIRESSPVDADDPVIYVDIVDWLIDKIYSLTVEDAVELMDALEAFLDNPTFETWLKLCFKIIQFLDPGVIFDGLMEFYQAVIDGCFDRIDDIRDAINKRRKMIEDEEEVTPKPVPIPDQNPKPKSKDDKPRKTCPPSEMPFTPGEPVEPITPINPIPRSSGGTAPMPIQPIKY